MVTLRPVEREMLPQIVELHVRSWQKAYRGMMPDEYLDSLSVESRLAQQQERFGKKTSDECAIIAGESIIGICGFGPSRDDDADQVGEIYGFYLHPDVWGKGYAHPAMTLTLELLKQAGWPVVTLWTLELNQRARRFYERAGFELDGARKQLTIAGVELWEVRYRKEL